jgi:ATP-dependent Clp protease ATP-binding subunit ClpC
MLKGVQSRVHDIGIQISFASSVAALLAKEGFDSAYGARPLRRAVVRLIEDALSGEMLEGKIAAGDSVIADVKEGKIEFQKA